MAQMGCVLNAMNLDPAMNGIHTITSVPIREIRVIRGQKSSVPKMPHAGKDHCHVAFIRGRDDFLVAH